METVTSQGRVGVAARATPGGGYGESVWTDRRVSDK